MRGSPINNLDIDNQLDENIKNIIVKMEQNIESKDKEIKSKNKEIDALKKELEFLKSQITSKNKKLFGQSSEQINSSQTSLFNEAEKESDLKQVEITILLFYMTINKLDQVFAQNHF